MYIHYIGINKYIFAYNGTMIKNINKSNSVGVGLIAKTLDLLNLFQFDSPYWSQSELAKVTGIKKSTVHRIVRFLLDERYLASVKGNRYSLGPASIELGRRAIGSFNLQELCYSVLLNISNETGETVILTALESSVNAVRCVDQIESTRSGLRVFNQIGSIFPLHGGAAAKAVLAFLSSAEIDQFLTTNLEQILPSTITNPNLLRQDLYNTKTRGFSISIEESQLGVAGIAAPYFWHNGTPFGSIAIGIPTQRATEETLLNYGPILVNAAKDISRLLNINTFITKNTTT